MQDQNNEEIHRRGRGRGRGRRRGSRRPTNAPYGGRRGRFKSMYFEILITYI